MSMHSSYHAVPGDEVDITSTPYGNDALIESRSSVSDKKPMLQTNRKSPAPTNPSLKKFFAYHAIFVLLALFGTIAIVRSGTESCRAQQREGPSRLAPALTSEDLDIPAFMRRRHAESLDRSYKVA